MLLTKFWRRVLLRFSCVTANKLIFCNRNAGPQGGPSLTCPISLDAEPFEVTFILYGRVHFTGSRQRDTNGCFGRFTGDCASGYRALFWRGASTIKMDVQIPVGVGQDVPYRLVEMGMSGPHRALIQY